MRKFKLNFNIKFRLIAYTVLLIAIVLSLACFFLLWNTSSFYNNKFQKEMSEAFSSDLVTKLTLAQDSNAAKQVLVDNYTILGININRSYYVLDNSGNVLSTSNPLQPKNVTSTNNIISAISGRVGNSNQSGTLKFVDFAYPLANGNIVYIQDNMQDFNMLSNYIFTIVWQMFILGIALSILLSIFLARTITKPIAKLTHKANLLADGDYDTKIDIRSNDEIGVLSQTFSRMASVITQSIQDISGERNKFETMLMHMSDGVIAFNINGSVMHINPAAKGLLNITDNEKTDFDDLFDQLGAEICIAELVYLDQERTITRRVDVGVAVLDFYFATFKDEQDHLSGIIVVIHDITEAEKIEKLRHEFVANVSHELRTPLTTIKSYAETLMEQESEDNATKSFINVIIKEVDRMTRIVKDLLTLSTLKFANSEDTKEYFSLDELLHEITDRMVIQATEAGHELEYISATNLPPLFADRDKIEQVIINLVSNAIKYTPKGHGRIEISSGFLYNKLYVKVRDNGIGIPAKDLPRIFERFYRIEKARARDKGGSGLGLAIAKEIVELHGGDISIDSKLGEGTEVMITFPQDVD
ncbi:MAG: cell wall metabolism sensor histidine kinase WalK [Clostridiales bacterium]|jgi:two-component system sensor histidine kinase VicK|nr:cell wall metabolism sensor histidine kinase WalK [Clostridiales bacterium]